MNKLQTKILYTGLQCILARMRSKSPALFVNIQWACGIIAALCAMVLAMAKAGFFSFLPTAEYNNMLILINAIGAGLTGCGIVATLPSTDPDLVSKEVKEAILNQAASDGTTLPVGTVNAIAPAPPADNITSAPIQPLLSINSQIKSKTMTVLQQIEAAVMAFLKKTERKLPTILEEGAAFGLEWTGKLETALESKEATEITALVPETEPFRVEIIAILEEAAVSFKAVAGGYQKGTLFIAAGKIGQLKVGTDVPMNRINLAVQAAYSSKPQSAIAA